MYFRNPIQVSDPTNNLIVRGNADYDHQELHIILGGGGPAGIEFKIHSSTKGVKILIWHPFNHEWVEVNQDALTYHGNTTISMCPDCGKENELKGHQDCPFPQD